MLLDLIHFIGRSGPAAAAWEKIYRDHSGRLSDCDRGLELMRKRRLEEGRRMLQEVIQLVHLERGLPKSMQLVMYHRCYAAEGYYYYSAGDCAQAKESKRAAHHSMVGAIEEDAFLLPLAIHCLDCYVHRARIERKSHQWREMKRILQQANAIVADRFPLCEPERGDPIFLSTVRGYMNAITPMTEVEREAVRKQVGDEWERDVDRFFRRLVCLPGFVIEYR